jgi:putative membrane protein
MFIKKAGKRMLSELKTFFNGLAFGVTQIVPGVSGGTIAIMLGFYDKLLETVNHFTKDYRKHLKFLIPFLLGVVFGILLFSSIIDYFLTNYSLPTMLFFIGLIVGIIPLIYLKVKELGRKLGRNEILLIIIPALVLMFISNLKGAQAAAPAEIIAGIGFPYMAFIFVSGVISAAALVTPGISGSFILLLFGVYHVVTYSLSAVRHLLADMTNISLMLDICKVMVPFAIGVVAGGLSMARLIETLLKKHHKKVYSIILGLLAGSVYALFKEPIVFQSGVSPVLIAASAATFLLGCAVSLYLGKKRL